MPTRPSPEPASHSRNKVAPRHGTGALKRWFRVLPDARQAILLLDYDGTLAPFTVDRAQAKPYRGLVELLCEIGINETNRIVIVSGRPSSEVVGLLGMQPAPEIFGLYGRERRTVDGAVTRMPLDETDIRALGDAERWLDYQQLRDRAEFKPGSVAVHWRGLEENIVTEIRARVLLGWQAIAEARKLCLEEFDGGLEIRPSEDNKGTVIRTVLAEVDENAAVAFLGDDAADEDAFEALRGRGLSALVRPDWRQTAADVWLRPPTGLLDFLTQWRDSRRSASGQSPDRKADPAGLEF